MDLNDTPEQAEYRARARDWLEQHADEAPKITRDDITPEVIDARRKWQGKLAEAGFVGITWPREYGGQGLGPLEQVVFTQELSRAKLPGILDVIGIGMLGPTIIAHGTEEQKQRYLGPMLHGDEVWCQLFSEPAAGSDLAGIQSRAKLQDDGTWRVSGQKVWTTNAQFASFGLMMVRTDADVPKHKGLTMFVVPMDADGVTVRPLRQISGEAHFNEVFFDDVALDEAAPVGPVGNGWGVGLTTLMYERVAIGLGGDGFGWRADRFATALAADEGASADPETRRRLGEVAADLLSLRFTGYRQLSLLQRGQVPGPRGRSGQDHHDPGGDRGGRPPGRRARPRRPRRQRVGRHGLRAAGAEVRRRHRGDPAQHGRRARARPAARAAAGQGHPVLRAARQGEGGGGRMNLALSDEQVFLQEAARGALGRFNTIAAARDALDGGELPDLWPTAREAGWSGLLVSDEHGGAGLGPFEAMLVMVECGRRLAPVPLLGHLPATALLDRSGEHPKLLASLAEGERRAAFVPARPPDSLDDAWTVDPLRGGRRAPAPRFDAGKQEGGPHPVDGTVTGDVHWVPDLPGVDAVVIVAVGEEGPVVLLADVEGTDGLTIEAVERYDATRSLGHLKLDGAPVTRLTLDADDAAFAWYLDQALLAAEALGVVEEALRALGRVRQGALRVRAPDRLLPVGQARPRRDPAAQGEPAQPRVLRGLGRGGESPTSCPWPPARRARWATARSTSPRASSSRSTAGSGRRGSTTRRCSSAARSCPSACSAGAPTAPSGWPTNSSQQPARGVA